MKSIYLAEWDLFVRYYVLPGHGTPLVYLPGLGTAAIPCMLPVATHPALRDHHAIMVDYPGMGHSEKPDHFDHLMSSYARVVAAILDQEGLRHVTIVGHSMGGTIGLELALQRPELVGNLILAESNLEPGGGPGSRRIAAIDEQDFMQNQYPQWLQNSREAAKQGDSRALNDLEYYHTSSPNAIYYGARALVQLDPIMREKFCTLPIPRAFIYGSETLRELAGKTMPDTPAIPEMEQYGIRCLIVQDSGHIMMEDNLEGYVAAIQACL